MLKKILIFFFYLQGRYIEKKLYDTNWLERERKKKLKKFIKFLKKKSKFYKNYIDKSLEFENFPIMNKKMMMENFNELNTIGLNKNEIFKVTIEAEEKRDYKEKINGVTVGLSSGTSGNRGIFLASFLEECKWTGKILSKTLPKGIFSKERIAFFLRANSNLYENINSSRIKFKFFNLFTDMEKNIEELNEYNPTILVAPASALREIAKRIEEGKINLSVYKIYSVAEVLEKDTKKYLENIFQQNIYEIYQATEGFLGTSCECGNIHLNEEFLIIEKEWIDERRFIPVITDLERKSQPIVRYRLNDILHLEKNCKCGRKTLAINKIEGREDDFIILKSLDGKKKIKIFPDYIRREIIITSLDILEYQVVQKNLEEIEIYLEIKENRDKKEICEKIENSLTKLFMKVGGINPKLNFFYKINIESGEKFRRIKGMKERVE